MPIARWGRVATGGSAGWKPAPPHAEASIRTWYNERRKAHLLATCYSLLATGDPACEGEVVFAGAVRVGQEADEAVADAQEEARRVIRVAAEIRQEAGR